MYKNGWVFWFFIFSSLAPNSTFIFVSHFVHYTVCFLLRDSSEDDDEKTKIHKLCTTQLFYKSIRNFYPSHRNLSHHIVALGIIALSLIRSSVHHHHQSMPRRLHRVEFSWFETKTYPIATHLDARSTWNLSRRSPSNPSASRAPL